MDRLQTFLHGLAVQEHAHGGIAVASMLEQLQRRAGGMEPDDIAEEVFTIYNDYLECAIQVARTEAE